MENKTLPVNKQMIEITKQLIERCYKYESQFFETIADRNICEAELQDIYETVDSVMSDLDLTEREKFEEEIEALEDERNSLQERILQLDEKNTELATQNYDLACEKKKLWDKLQEVSKVVNDTWC